ncbi:SGNH/GDSL hydrolase family protein [Streptomyces sp. NPDC051211]|uniref:SGNH/GDSL hydrolase family protein n=1 Tax=Streptomyces sp. NPDC051211 TaxID=3154643 RepID=UPI00344B3742
MNAVNALNTLNALNTAKAAALATATALAATAAALTPAAAAPRPAPAEYVAIGDSYSANTFVRPWNGGPADTCGRSLVNYPSQAARRLQVTLTDVTCGAAEVRAGVLEPQPAEGRYGPNPPQLNALSPTTSLVTIGVGGNSLGFEDILRECLARGLGALGFGKPCTTYYTQRDGAAWLSQKFADLDADYTAMLKAVHQRAPRAKVALVGYPAIVGSNATTNTGCTWGQWRRFGTVAKGDMPWLDSVERRLNDLIRNQATQAGHAYVDTYTPSAGHGVCAPSGQKWIYGVKDDLTGEGTQQDDRPLPSCALIPGDGEACTFIHPNANGARSQADAVTAALIGLGAAARPS